MEIMECKIIIQVNGANCIYFLPNSDICYVMSSKTIHFWTIHSITIQSILCILEEYGCIVYGG
jgi:hypothetical protein